MKDTKGLKATQMVSGDVTKYLRFYKMGLFFIALFGIYLGLQGLYLILVTGNYIPGVALFLAALLLSPPPIGISNMVASQLHLELTMGIKVGFSALLLVIAYWFL